LSVGAVKILALDTATENCSVALLLGNEIQGEERELGRDHALEILPMIDRVMTAANLRLADLDAIAFGRGPGGFTGVRLAASVAQGLAFSAQRPVLPVSNLRALAARGLAAAPQATAALVCADARMSEVYTACFARCHADSALQLVSKEQVCAPPQVQLAAGLAAKNCVAVGRGFSAYPELAAIGRRGWHAVLFDTLPRAREIAIIAACDFAAGRQLPAAEALPVYLRDRVTS
jgi:tRNA threonylcarbamoyladenosine biosynthesis protein TsaB